MKCFFFFVLFFTGILASYSTVKADSLTYYYTLSNQNIKDDNYRNALFFTQKAIQFAKKNNQNIEQALHEFNLGKILYDLKKYDDALVSFLKSATLNNTSTSNKTKAESYYHIGLCYMAKENYKEASLYFNNAENLFKVLKTTNKILEVKLQKGLINRFNGKTQEAMTIFKSIIYMPEVSVLEDLKAKTLYQIGTIESQYNRNNLAIAYLKKALNTNNKINNIELKTSIVLALSTVYDKTLDKNLAYQYLKQYLKLKEELTFLNNKRLGVDDYAKFKESERLKEQNQFKIQKEEELKSKKISKIISILAIALITILSLLSLSLYKNNKIRTKSNQLLKDKNKELEIAKNKVEKASQARSEFLSTVSHELRTPLNAINGITHLLLEEDPKKNQIDYLSSLKFSGDYLTKFINEILEINKIESNKTEIEEIPFNLKQLLINIKQSLKELAIVNNNDFKLDVDYSIPDFLIGDPTKLSQIILNLINNALKFTKNGVVNVVAKLNNLEDNYATLDFEIIDTGIGIPAEKLESVFDSFSQGSIEVNRKYGGTGLGLTIVKKLITILGGEIHLKSTVNKGSTFSFQLKFEIGKKPIDIVSTSKQNYESKLINKKILLVEDNKINQMITTKMLFNKKVICEVIDNGEEAIELLKISKFDLILMDVHLPGINGTIATETIRKFDTITPIIALTAISLDENREMLLSFGMNDVITKPFIPEVFYSIIADHLK
ncbi:ATP-binding protein [Flavobacterium sp. FPG59]|jgi:signal transduction histidine kinase/CheY-like chemotaxis protein|uniref:tetratricopeptide repeat-containing hybrid sensor histidine kinase/response regulator n=1 Tax=Flavobacterium sp. FPG59 TaxID=1929267 RepID=UPI000A3D586F|nr:ATP-binding protein [Flavobacterium sp. FPG59]OUD36810.1 hybrid sensor histidine kinase/response regulator [Flavobacterium sp. FPG59]